MNITLLKIRPIVLRPIKAIAYISLCIFLSYACSKRATSEHLKAAQLLDTLQYGEREYDMMRHYFRNDSLFQNGLEEQLAKGDAYAIKLQTLFDTDFDSRYESKLEQRDIDGLMLSFYAINDVANKFDKIEKLLDSTRADRKSVV